VQSAVDVVPATFDDVLELFAELDVDLDRRYGGGEPVFFAKEHFDPPGGALLTATVIGGEVPAPGPTRRLAGCVGLRALPGVPGVAELKRMYVRPEARRRGVARALLAGCEAAASERGYESLWLETGLQQPEAIALYVSAGYVEVPRFGQYRNESESVYLGRRLSDGRAPQRESPTR
jgi:ribosomal protein S18 acetylase RimI-like enzyme